MRNNVNNSANVNNINVNTTSTPTNKKYTMTADTREVDGKILHRIRALKDFRGIKAGELGGWIQKEGNLDQQGLCWVADEACVMDNAWVTGNAKVCDFAQVQGNATVGGRAFVCGRAYVEDDAFVYDNAVVLDMSTVCGKAKVKRDTILEGTSTVRE